MPTNRRRRNRTYQHISEPMRNFLLYGISDESTETDFDVFVIEPHENLIIKEWLKHRNRLLSEWKHKDVLPYGEALYQDNDPDTERLEKLYEEKEGSNGR